MKITKETLKQIIIEELDSQTQPINQDVTRVLQYIDKIDNKKEYHQLLQKILLHEIDGKEQVLSKLLGNNIATAILKLADTNSPEQ